MFPGSWFEFELWNARWLQQFTSVVWRISCSSPLVVLKCFGRCCMTCVSVFSVVSRLDGGNGFLPRSE
jgi:hypothetical protein